jgi:hypothetical protein
VFMFEGIRQYLIEDFDLIRRHLNQLESERVRSSSALAVVDELGKSELRNSISRLWISGETVPVGTGCGSTWCAFAALCGARSAVLYCVPNVCIAVGSAAIGKSATSHPPPRAR